MDFARRQLEKYGWSDGKGLGKHENGISEALKPKLKRSVTGVGHDPAAEFNEHWWSALYDKAAKNVQVEEKNGKTKKIKTVDGEDFTITNSTWRINKKRKSKSNDNEYSEYFIKKATLTNDGTKVENVSDSESDENDEPKKDVMKMTDEQLFAACEGRTAHKGARHGLKATGKLARIARQEEMLLQLSKYKGYSSHKIKHKNQDVVEDISLVNSQEDKPKIKKKKKRKRCITNENIGEQAECKVLPMSDQDLKSKEINGDASEIKENVDGKKSKKSKRFAHDNKNDQDSDGKTKKQKKHLIEQADEDIETTNDTEVVVEAPKKKKKKNKYDLEEI